MRFLLPLIRSVAGSRADRFDSAVNYKSFQVGRACVPSQTNKETCVCLVKSLTRASNGGSARYRVAAEIHPAGWKRSTVAGTFQHSICTSFAEFLTDSENNTCAEAYKVLTAETCLCCPKRSYSPLKSSCCCFYELELAISLLKGSELTWNSALFVIQDLRSWKKFIHHEWDNEVEGHGCAGLQRRSGHQLHLGMANGAGLRSDLLHGKLVRRLSPVLSFVSSFRNQIIICFRVHVHLFFTLMLDIFLAVFFRRWVKKKQTERGRKKSRSHLDSCSWMTWQTRIKYVFVDSMSHVLWTGVGQ